MQHISHCLCGDTGYEFTYTLGRDPLPPRHRHSGRRGVGFECIISIHLHIGQVLLSHIKVATNVSKLYSMFIKPLGRVLSLDHAEYHQTYYCKYHHENKSTLLVKILIPYIITIVLYLIITIVIPDKYNSNPI